MPRTGPHMACSDETTPLSLPKLNPYPRHLRPLLTEACLVTSNTGLSCRRKQHLGDCSPHTTDLANTSNQDPSQLLERASLSLQDPLSPDITGLHEGVTLSRISLSASSLQPAGPGKDHCLPSAPLSRGLSGASLSRLAIFFFILFFFILLLVCG